MELPQLGRQCSQADCKQLDFLPLQCKCNKQFCSEHFNSHVKSCAVFSRAEAETRKITEVYKCSRADCNETSIVPLICERCHNHFCVRHRHLTECHSKDPKQVAREKERYAAPVREFNQAKRVVDEQIEENLNRARKKEKNRDMVNRVQLMKIKQKATGLKTIPVSDRVYFNVTYSEGGSDKVTPVFVSKTWTLGRSIDAIATECKLKNNNNKSTEKKLRLFKKEDGAVVSRNLADVLSFLLNKIIVDGENLIIAYVDDNCEHL